MKTCTRCQLNFEDSVAYCSVCGSPLSAVPPTAYAAPTYDYAVPPTPSRKPPALARSIVGLVLSASGLECAIGTAVFQIYISLLSVIFRGVSMIDPSSAAELGFVEGFFNGYMFVWAVFLGGAALALSLVGQHLAKQCVALGNTSRLISVNRILSRIAIIITVVALALSFIHFAVSLIGLAV